MLNCFLSTMPNDRVPLLRVVMLVHRAGMAGTVGTRGNYPPPYVGTASSRTKTSVSGELCITMINP